MNFGIAVDSAGVGTMTWAKPTDIGTNIWWSLNIDQGAVFNNVEFGFKVDDIKKVTAGNIGLLTQRVEKALQWLLNTGKAQSVEVLVERDSLDFNRINWKVTAVQADGFPITVTSFRTIGGPSGGFSV